MRRQLSSAAAGFALLAFPALGQQSSPPSPAMTGSHSAADRAMMDGMNRMSQAMSGVQMSGDPDRDFVAMMIPHHQGAIDMAKAELQYGKDPMLRKMARDIVVAQEKEIAAMENWQKRNPAR